MSKVEDLKQQLQEAQREEEEKAHSERKCRVCGEKDEQYGGQNGYLVDFDFVIADREEGFSNAKGWLCEEHLSTVTDALIQAGLGLHVHGGICFLEDTSCPGYQTRKACATPEKQYED